MRRKGIVFVLAIAIAAIGGIVFASPASAMEPHPLKPWMAGIGIGFGPSKIFGGPQLSDLETAWTGGIAPQIRLAHRLGGKTMLGFSLNDWMSEQGATDPNVRVNTQNFNATLTWFPGNPEGVTGGIFLHGGVGFANARIVKRETSVTATDTTEVETHEDEGGLGLMFGGGYEFRVSPAFAIGADVTANHQSIGQDLVDHNWFVPVTLRLNWYF